MQYHPFSLCKPFMPKAFVFLLLGSLFFLSAVAQQTTTTKNVFVICIDGLRWQEIFTGADSAMVNDEHYVKDTALVKDQYWSADVQKRRERLMPFFWSVIQKNGTLYGNRVYENDVEVKNAFKISYPGYSEMLSGHPDWLLIPDLRINNRNDNVLEYLNDQPDLHGKVAAFTSWDVFPYIFNKNKTHFLVNSGYENVKGETSDSAAIINAVQNGIQKKEHTRYDLLTFLNAKEYATAHHPKVLFLSFGETDEFAHQGRYDLYLSQANKIDKMIADLWYFLQTDSYYKNNTTVLITTDHGRGNNASTWHNHNGLVCGSGEIWLALLGTTIPALGEAKSKQVIYQQQFAATIAAAVGKRYTVTPRIAPPISINKPVAWVAVSHGSFIGQPTNEDDVPGD